uniref:CxC5 like cysteine cluster associated with KDZ domain-containing protein n=1 Tax=Amphimedon queenslandica TaxID=400682 RepID=A0A1X7TCX0_AMPQE
MDDLEATRRMLFATSWLPSDTPNYWNMVAKFSKSSITPESAKIQMENVQVFSHECFISDHNLTLELIEMECPVTKKHLGIPLVPLNDCCLSCGGKFHLRKDRPARLTLYTETVGTVLASHFHKYCQNSGKGCKFVQFYGFYRSEDGSLCYNHNWDALQYFISSQETGFELKMLQHFDTELLIGQLSYKQKADIKRI